MAETTELKNIGLRGVKVADTRISDVDGEKGVLIYRGFNVVDLARASTYEEVSFLLLNDRLPTRQELEGFRQELVSERAVPGVVLEFMRMMPKSAHPMDILQSAVPMLASFRSPAARGDERGQLQKGHSTDCKDGHPRCSVGSDSERP